MGKQDAGEICIGIQIGVSYRELRSRDRVLLIGRSAPGQEDPPQIDLAQDESVSRRHAEIRQVGDGYTVADLGSSNGTWLNGKRISPGEPMRFKEGDRIAVGRLSVLRMSASGVETKDAGSPTEI